MQGSLDAFPFPITLVVNYISREAKQQVQLGGGTAHSAYLNHMGLQAATEVRVQRRADQCCVLSPPSYQHSIQAT